MPGFFYGIGISYRIKMLRRDAHSREDEICRKRPRSAREYAKAHSLHVITKEADG